MNKSTQKPIESKEKSIDPCERQLRELYETNLLYTKKDMYDLLSHPPTYIDHWVSRLRNIHTCGKKGLAGTKTVICLDGGRRYGNDKASKHYKVNTGSETLRD